MVEKTLNATTTYQNSPCDKFQSANSSGECGISWLYINVDPNQNHQILSRPNPFKIFRDSFHPWPNLGICLSTCKRYMKGC